MHRKSKRLYESIHRSFVRPGAFKQLTNCESAIDQSINVDIELVKSSSVYDLLMIVFVSQTILFTKSISFPCKFLSVIPSIVSSWWWMFIISLSMHLCLLDSVSTIAGLSKSTLWPVFCTCTFSVFFFLIAYFSSFFLLWNFSGLSYIFHVTILAIYFTYEANFFVSFKFIFL